MAITDKAADAWLASQKKSTYWAYKTHWNRFREFTGMSGDQILEERKNDKDFYWEAKVLEFKQRLMEVPFRLSSNSATAASQAIRGFFAFHRMPLVFQRRETRKLNEHVRTTEDYRFTLEDLRRMDEVADLPEKYVLRLGKSFGLRAGDFLRISRGDIEPYLSNPIPISIGTYKTQKEGVAAYPFVDSDALPVVKLMLEKATREGRTKQTDRILTFKRNLELSRTLRRLVQKAGINVGNKKVRFHCLRKFLCDHLSSNMAESKWKQIVGKKIGESAYISPDELGKDYAKALPETTLAEDKEVKDRLKELEEFTKGLTPEQIARAKRLQLLRTHTKRDKSEKPDDSCKDGSHCQKIVEESELGTLLGQGWTVKAVLPSGKIVISNEA